MPSPKHLSNNSVFVYIDKVVDDAPVTLLAGRRQRLLQQRLLHL